MKIISAIFITIIFSTFLFAQNKQIDYLNRFQKVERKSSLEFKKTVKKKGLLTKEEWQALIDERWGPGLPTDQKLQIFDNFWYRIDRYSSVFPNLDVDWDSLRNKYRPEVEAGVSRGRFNAIINHMSLALHENHPGPRNSKSLWHSRC